MSEDLNEGSAERTQELRPRIEKHQRNLREAWRREQRRLGLNPSELAVPRVLVEAGNKPSNEQLIDEWNAHLKERGLSDKVRGRKVRHVDAFTYCLYESASEADATHLLDAGEAEIDLFFFWTYIRRFRGSASGAKNLALDIRDFYRFQQQRGRIADARFAELIYGVRDFVAERVELYEHLQSAGLSDDDFDDLYEALLIG